MNEPPDPEEAEETSEVTADADLDTLDILAGALLDVMIQSETDQGPTPEASTPPPSEAPRRS